jgi:predicted porin
VRKLLICAAALSGFAAQASAADLASMKDPLPENVEFHGVTIYGTVDVGYGYQDHGVPVSGAFYTALNYIPNKYTGDSQSALIGNALEQSKIGAKIEQQLGMGFNAIGKLETGFNPWSGEIADACASLVRAAKQGSVAGSKVETNGDGARCGQLLNGVAYAGLSNPLYGTLTLGRHNSLVTDGIGTYDPMKGSYALSLIGYSGGALGGIGSTETTRWDNAVKYVFTYGPAHVAGMYSSGGEDTAIMDDAYGVNVGLTYKGFAVDGFYTKTNGAVNLGSDSTNTLYWLKATVTDNEAWTAMAKYTFEFGGSFKDDAPSSKFTVFGGYNQTEMTDAGYTAGTILTTVGGYAAPVAATGYYSERVLETFWTGATYETGPWAFTGAYYHQSQDFYQSAAGEASCSSSLKKNCSGGIDMGSFLVDYKVNKHFDIYAGVSIAEVDGGFAAGVTKTDQTNFVSGLRLKF